MITKLTVVDATGRHGSRWALEELLAPIAGKQGLVFARSADGADVAISYGDHLPDALAKNHVHIYVGGACHNAPEAVPANGLTRLSPSDLAIPPAQMTRSDLPMVHVANEIGGPMTTTSRNGDTTLITTKADLVSSSFFWLSRVEEARSAHRDPWGRVPEKTLLAVIEGVADRALVDEYRAVFREWLGSMGVESPEPGRPSVLLSHDIDSGIKATRGPFWSHLIRGVGRDLIRHRSPTTAFELGVNGIAVGVGLTPPFGSVADIVKESEGRGLKSHFFFMANGTHRDDATYDVFARQTVDEIKTALGRGHRVGLHVGIDAYADSAALLREWNDLGKASGDRPFGTRTHFFGFRVPDTWAAMARLGVGFDSSMGLSDMCGFRTGTTHPHRVFDLAQDRALDLIEAPVMIMDKAIYNLPAERRSAIVDNIVQTVKRHGGCLVINWHYWYFTSRYLTIYRDLLDRLDGFEDGSPRIMEASCPS